LRRPHLNQSLGYHAGVILRMPVFHVRSHYYISPSVTLALTSGTHDWVIFSRNPFLAHVYVYRWLQYGFKHRVQFIYRFPCLSFNFLWPPYETGRPLYFCPVVTIFLSIFFSSPNLSCRRLDVYHTSTHGSLEIQDAKNPHFGTIAQLCRAISLELRHVSTIGKKLFKQQYLLHMS